MILGDNDEDNSTVVSFSSNLLKVLNQDLQKSVSNRRALICIEK